MPTFKVQGQVYHRIGSLLHEETSTPKFLQLYFTADYNLQAETRIGILPPSGRVPRRDVILLLQSMLHKVNSYIRSFKYALENARFPSFSIVIDANTWPHDEHERRYNAPACNEVAAIIHREQDRTRDIVFKSRGGDLRRISETHRSYGALQYPLLFTYGDDRYHFGIPLHTPGGQPTTSSKALSCKAFYSYRFMVRDGHFNMLHTCRELFHQFAADITAKMKLERLCFIRNHWKQLHSDSYIHLRDSLRNEVNPRDLGKLCILPSTYTGGPRYMHERTQHAMTYVRPYERPDLFITFTCNPKWVDIMRELLPGQYYTHRHDITARVFHLKLGKLMDLIVKGRVLQ
ncbi:unnamed protein product [Acanthosepion pharaonis]|uniref:Helitron helicase-like domain-containing protein n=1 Tax=Acanthosepion pharaonis TaxID=158019 RepID=A0A812EHV2_ACAPH|nr:unnamed protein product [Sepia pharaonis]